MSLRSNMLLLRKQRVEEQKQKQGFLLGGAAEVQGRKEGYLNLGDNNEDKEKYLTWVIVQKQKHLADELDVRGKRKEEKQY